MPRPPRFPAPDRPDPEALLLAAVAERDTLQALKLADRLTHRRGLAAFQSLVATKLAAGQGQEAVLWLAALVRFELSPIQVEPLADGAKTVQAVEAEAPFTDPWQLPAVHLDPVVIQEPAPAAAASSLDPTWLDDLAREQQALADFSRESQPQTFSDPSPADPSPADPSSPEPLPADPLPAGAPLPAEASEHVWVFGQPAHNGMADPGESPDSLAMAGCDNPFPSSPGEAAGTTAASMPEPSHPLALIPRLMAVSPPARSPRQGPAPAPASLARLRSWLHDDALPEAS
ncbi:hypothetical protein [Cyanobium sp. NIES-981]|uniref:hypothetical protein n=1 Tax=Cyanobium sp. NIES-981 TaxID=1851505 RepID=UPI0007DE08A0|nr:hypothetical protein [Cyanobium sp. NIES-981]SBO43002.1 conserved protein of unknown function [Cyanobium sp. NIES-981]